MIVEFLDEARQELIEAALWYEGKEPGLGKRFRNEIAFVGMLKKAASGVPCLRRSGYAQAGRHFAVLTYSMYAPRVKQWRGLSGPNKQ